MTGKFSNQGTLSTSDTVIHTAPDNNMSEVRSLRFNNPLAYTLTLVKYPSAIQIYSLTLSGGATIVGAPSTLTANTPVCFQYNHANATWYISL